MADESERATSITAFRGWFLMLFAGLMGFFGMQTGPAAKPTASTAKKASEKKVSAEGGH